MWTQYPCLYGGWPAGGTVTPKNRASLRGGRGLLLHFQMIIFYFHFLLSLHRCSEASEVAAVKCRNIKQSLLESVLPSAGRLVYFGH